MKTASDAMDEAADRMELLPAVYKAQPQTYDETVAVLAKERLRLHPPPPPKPFVFVPKK